MIRPVVSPEPIGWAASATLHVAGAVAAWMLAMGAMSSERPVLPGHESRVELLATWQELQPPAEELPPLDAQVLITPRRAHVGRREFVPTPTTAPAEPAELARAEPLEVAALPTARPAESAPAPTAVSPPPRSVRPATLRQSAVAEPVVPASRPRNASAGTDPQTPPKLLDNLPPSYPPQAVIDRLQGTVLLRVHVAADGHVARVEVLTTSGHRTLDAAAIRAVRTWQFLPAQRHGQPVAATLRLPVQFVLD